MKYSATKRKGLIMTDGERTMRWIKRYHPTIAVARFLKYVYWTIYRATRYN